MRQDLSLQKAPCNFSISLWNICAQKMPGSKGKNINNPGIKPLRHSIILHGLDLGILHTSSLCSCFSIMWRSDLWVNSQPEIGMWDLLAYIYIYGGWKPLAWMTCPLESLWSSCECTEVTSSFLERESEFGKELRDQKDRRKSQEELFYQSWIGWLFSLSLSLSLFFFNL